MEPTYETTDQMPVLQFLLVICGIGMIAMAFAVPLDPEAPDLLVWIMTPLMVFFGILTFLVTPRIRLRAFPDYIEVRYGLTNLVKFKLDRTRITDVEAVKYNPLMEFGGWGIKQGGGNYRGFTAYTASITNRALVIRTTQKNYLIGCPDPEEAETMVRNAIGMKARQPDTTASSH